MNTITEELKRIALGRPRGPSVTRALIKLNLIKGGGRAVPVIGWVLLLHTAVTKGVDAAARDFAMQDLLEGAVDWVHEGLDNFKAEGTALLMRRYEGLSYDSWYDN